MTTSPVKHLSQSELASGLDHIRQSPADGGVVELIVRRPREHEREVLAEAQLDLDEGLVGDNWRTRGSRHRPDGSADPLAQLTIMNARAIALLAGNKNHWPLAGDQLLVDLDLSETNLPPGTRLAVGSAVVEISATPHTGCRLFTDRFGVEATKFVNSVVGRQLRLRGLNAKIVQGGSVKVGDIARKL